MHLTPSPPLQVTKKRNSLWCVSPGREAWRPPSWGSREMKKESHYLYYLKKNFFSHTWWDPRSPIRGRTFDLCFGRQSLNHWTIREVPGDSLSRTETTRPAWGLRGWGDPRAGYGHTWGQCGYLFYYSFQKESWKFLEIRNLLSTSYHNKWLLNTNLYDSRPSHYGFWENPPRLTIPLVIERWPNLRQNLSGLLRPPHITAIIWENGVSLYKY